MVGFCGVWALGFGESPTPKAQTPQNPNHDDLSEWIKVAYRPKIDAATFLVRGSQDDAEGKSSSAISIKVITKFNMH